ncbi:MAG: L-threonylcarbamoyladenylate synthase [Alphaproteobacteria bacterium]
MSTIRPATDAAIEEAARLLRDGRLVAFPTETVYGLGADATNGEAVAAIFEAKGRPRFNPLIAHVAEMAAARALVRLTPEQEELAARFWPGPLTLVGPRAPDCPVSDLASAGLGTLAVRVPGHEVALALLRAAGRPVAAPSANRSESVSPTTATHVAAGLGDAVDLILDGGPCEVGLESTVVGADERGLVLLRPGGVPVEEIEAVAGKLHAPPPGGEKEAPLSPGQLRRHYAPGARLRLNADAPEPGEALIAFGPVPEGITPLANLSPRGDLREAAANLFAALHRLDAEGVTRTAVMPVPERGLGRAINDRLRRAASGM